MEKNNKKNPSSSVQNGTTPRVFSNSSENPKNSETAENIETDIINKNTESLFIFKKSDIASNLDFIHSKKKNKRKVETIIEPSLPNF